MQPLKTLDPMEVTDSGMVIEVSPVQPEKTPCPMVSNELLRVTVKGLVQFSNVVPSRTVTELLMVTEANRVQLANAPYPMEATGSGMSTVVRLLQL
jgi:hypothetical protein